MFSEIQFKNEVLKNPGFLLKKTVNPGIALSTSTELLEFCLQHRGWVDSEILFAQVHRTDFFFKALDVFLKENPNVLVHQILNRNKMSLLFCMELDIIMDLRFKKFLTKELFLVTDDEGDTFLSVYKYILPGFFTLLGEENLVALLQIKNFLGTRNLESFVMDEIFSVLGEKNSVKFVLYPSENLEDLPGTLILHHKNFDYLRKLAVEAAAEIAPSRRITRRFSQILRDAIVDKCPSRLAVRKLLL